MTLRVRQLGEAYLSGYRDIRLEALKMHPEAFGDAYEAAAQREDSHFLDSLRRMAIFGAFAADGHQLGLAAFRRNEGAKSMHRGNLFQMYVRPEARGTGCALELIEAVAAHAARIVKQLHLSVVTTNEAAIRLYQRAGFHIYGTEPRSLFVNGRYIDEHLMVRFFDKAPGKKNENV